MLTHLEFEQVKRALERMRSERNSSEQVERKDVIDILIPYVEGYKAPDPHGPVITFGSTEGK